MKTHTLIFILLWGFWFR